MYQICSATSYWPLTKKMYTRSKRRLQITPQYSVVMPKNRVCNQTAEKPQNSSLNTFVRHASCHVPPSVNQGPRKSVLAQLVRKFPTFCKPAVPFAFFQKRSSLAPVLNEPNPGDIRIRFNFTNATLVFVTLYGWRLVCWLDFQPNEQTRRHPYRVTNTSVA